MLYRKNLFSKKNLKKGIALFFHQVERTYGDVIHSILALIDEGKEYYSSHSEINFILQLIAKLRLDFNHNSHLTFEILEEMFNGGHLKFEDNGTFYNELVATFGTNLHKRSSSHNSCVQQYSFSGPVVKEVLFGISIDAKGRPLTWMQFEKHNTRTIIEFILHIFDYLIHKCTGKNIGPYGLSNYTEHNPLILKIK